MQEGAVMLGDDNSILYCNKGFAEMVKIPLDKLFGANIENVVAQEHIEAFRQLLAAGMSRNDNAQREITFQAGKDKIVPALTSVRTLKANDITTTFVVTTDLSKHMQDDLKRYTQDLESTVAERTKQLKESERLAVIGQTAGMVGHDIRNPLQSIVSELYLARQELEAMPNNEVKVGLKESIDSIEAQTFYINKIVADLQDFTKPLAPNPQPTDIATIIHDSLSSVVPPENIAVDVQAEKTAPKVDVDAIYLKRVIINLISNAVQAMPNGGKLTIETDYTNSQASITVHDTGMGIPEHVKPQIFQPLFTTKAKGQGLGLAVVKRLTEALDGTVTFESQVGNGTAFHS